MGKEEPNEDLGHPLPFDPDFHGPLKNRSCTDVICLLIFLVFIGCWIGIGAYAIIHGNPTTLLVPRDSQGRRCGLDITNKPYLFFFDLTKCIDPTTPIVGCKTPQVCVEQCPDTNFYYKENGDNTPALKYCENEVHTYEVDKCPSWFLKSVSFQKRCIPDLNKISESDLGNTSLSDLKEAISNIKLLAYAEQVADQVIADVMTSWWKILIGITLALLVCIIYILMLRWIAGPMVWISIIGVVVALSAGVYFSATEYKKWVSKYASDPDSTSKTKRNIFLGILIIVSVVLGIIVLMIIFLRKRILLAIALVKEGSRAVSSVTSSLFFPILPWLLQVGVIAYSIFVGLYLATMGEPIYKVNDCAMNTSLKNNDYCSPNNFSCPNSTCKFIGMKNEAYYPYLQAYNIFGFFWLAFFVSAMGQMVLAQIFAQWYWTFKKRDLPFFAITAAFYRTLRYHLGTLAFGSLIIAICRMIRVCLEYIDRKLKRYDNEFTKAIICCLKCFFWCLEKFLKFINKNAYIMCAIHGKNFCASAKDAFMLLMRNIVRVFVLDKITDFLFFLSKILVTVGVGAVAYLFFVSDLVSFVDNSSLNFAVVPVIIIMVATYLISTLFFSVYSMAVDTLFLCFLEDCERNDGSSEKPYYMSRNLMKIFGKNNKVKKY